MVLLVECLFHRMNALAVSSIPHMPAALATFAGAHRCKVVCQIHQLTYHWYKVDNIKLIFNKPLPREKYLFADRVSSRWK